MKYIDPDGRENGIPPSIEKKLLEREYNQLFNNQNHDPDRAVKLIDNLYKRIPDFNERLAAAASADDPDKALGRLYENCFPGFRRSNNGSSLATQINSFLQGSSVPVGAGPSVTILGYGNARYMDSEGRKYKNETLSNEFAGASFDFFVGSGFELSVGSRHLGFGVMFKNQKQGGFRISGFALHIGVFIPTAPVTGTITVSEEDY